MGQTAIFHWYLTKKTDVLCVDAPYLLCCICKVQLNQAKVNYITGGGL
jgi:hypothetical protein